MGAGARQSGRQPKITSHTGRRQAQIQTDSKEKILLSSLLLLLLLL